MRPLFVVPFALASSSAFAANPLAVQLVADTTAVVPGEPFTLGLRLQHPAGWHTYWKHPGAVGLATTVKWELPPNFRAGEIQWPAPRVVTMAGHQAQGYEGEVLLMIPMTTVPATISAKEATFTARVSWMCCGTTCEPAADVPVSLTLPVADAAAPANAELFAKFRALVPQTDSAWKTSVRRDGDIVLLTVKPPSPSGAAPEIRFFTGDGQIDSDSPQKFETSKTGDFRLSLVKSEFGPAAAPSLPGVFAISAGGETHWIAIDPRYSGCAAR